MTLDELLDYFKNEHNLDITLFSQGVCILCLFFLQQTKRSEILCFGKEIFCCQREAVHGRFPRYRSLSIHLECSPTRWGSLENSSLRRDSPRGAPQRYANSKHL